MFGTAKSGFGGCRGQVESIVHSKQHAQIGGQSNHQKSFMLFSRAENASPVRPLVRRSDNDDSDHEAA
jgi:hypothetical protein